LHLSGLVVTLRRWYLPPCMCSLLSLPVPSCTSKISYTPLHHPQIRPSTPRQLMPEMAIVLWSDERALSNHITSRYLFQSWRSYRVHPVL
jgi:hypothetical protein